MHYKNRGFTLIEILIVISILAILGVAVIPNFFDIDNRSRVVVTKQNLEAIRSAINMYKVKSGDFPSADLAELYTVSFNDSGVERPLLDRLPPELISSDSEATHGDPPNRKVHASLSTEGGWFYDAKRAKLCVNFNSVLEEKWEKYVGENPSEW